jgi:hypothetical protein
VSSLPNIYGQQELLSNIGNKIHRPVDGLVLFEEKVIEKSAEAIKESQILSTSVPAVGDVLQWFTKFSAKQIDGSSNSWLIATNPFDDTTELSLLHAVKSSADVSSSTVKAVGFLCPKDVVTYTKTAYYDSVGMPERSLLASPLAFTSMVYTCGDPTWKYGSLIGLVYTATSVLTGRRNTNDSLLFCLITSLWRAKI